MSRKAKTKAGKPAALADLRALSPQGTLAARFDPGGRSFLQADVFRQLGLGARRFDLGDHGLYLAEEVVACDPFAGGRDRDALAIALLAIQVAARQGSTRVPLDPKGPLRDLVAALLAAAELDAGVDATVADIVRVTGQGGLGALVGGPGQVRPLIVADGCLYQHRLWWLETRLAERIATRIAGAPLDDAAAIGAAVGEVIARPAQVVLTAQQAAAVRTALAGRLGVISGGPGTGKTAIVVSLVRALARLGGAAGGPIALAAPTGKAANRMTGSVAVDLAAIADPDPRDRALAAAPPVAQTLHRLLGWRPDGGFRHSELSPLPHAAVIVDEASMIDLALMERLARAVRPDARLILLGDAHQLPSVDAGAVLSDLVLLAKGDGAPWAIELTESHRMRPDDPAGRAILEAARAIDAGQTGRLLDGPERVASRRISVADSTGLGVELVQATSAAQLGVALDQWWAKTASEDPRFERLAGRAYRRRPDDAAGWDGDDLAALGELLALHEQRRILTVTRGLDTGAIAVNARLHGRMLARSSAELAPDFLPGEPVIITANDYQRGLYNGDQGVVVRVVDGDDGAQRWRAVFRRGTELVPLPIDAVRSSMELAWAMTVHKSQGSEFERIALVLPREDMPLLTRELLYTALTRARRGALILGTAAVLEAGGARTASRQSGLSGRMRRSPP